jgi:hypothetical protein
VEIVEHGGEQGLALGRCRPGRIAIAAGAAVVRRIRVRRRQCARHRLLQIGAGFGARHVDQIRRQRQHQRRFQFVGVAAMALLGQLPGDAGVARTFVDPQMLDPLAGKARQCTVDGGQRADPGVEYEQLCASVAENLPGDLAHQRLEGRNRKAAAAGVFDEGRVMTVGQRRPDQRIDFFRHLAREPFGLNAVGIEGQVEAVLLGRGADRQYRRRPIADAPRDFIPTHTFDEMAVGIGSHLPGVLVMSRRKLPSKVLP